MTMPTKTIKDFIGVYDGWMPEQVCDASIELFKELDAQKKSYTRLDQNTSENRKKDLSVSLEFQEQQSWPSLIPAFIPNLMNAINNYLKEVPLKEYEGYEELMFNSIKIQKTLPAQGYHIWHQEACVSMMYKTRVLVYTVYLNDVDEGGETEFLYQTQRVKPKKGRIVIWPAGFPFVHRGNPPLKGEKYIITSWLSGEFRLT